MRKERLTLLAYCVKAVTGIAGTSLVLTENHPYITIAVLMIGAVTNEVIDHLKGNKKIDKPT